MSSQKVIFIFLISASVIGLTFIFVRRFSEASCPQNDTRICQFLQKNKNISTQEMKGSYLSNQEDKTELVVQWQKKDELSSIQIQKDEEEILHTIVTSQYVFLKDYVDNKWWREQKNTVENSLIELPFNPELFFASIQELIRNNNTTYTFIEDISCGDEVCHRYQVIYPEQSEGEQLFIFFSTADFKLKSIFTVGNQGTGKLDIIYEELNIVEPTDIKIVSSGRNIFTEYIELRNKEVPKDFEYLREFQQQRLESEGSSTIPYVEEIATEESELSL